MASPIVEIKHANPKSLSREYKETIKSAVHVQPGYIGCVVRLGHGNSSLPPQQWFDWWPNRHGMVQAIIAREMGTLQTFDDKTLFLDIETDSSEEMWNQPIEEFFRLGQYAWGEGEVTVTTSLQEIWDVILKAETVIAHNGHNFDFSVLLGDKALDLTMVDKLFDTWTHATLVTPAPFWFTARNGTTYKNASKPENARRWFGLDNLSFQFGLEGKFTSDDGSGLKALAKKYGGFGKIPLDDPDYNAYAAQDIVALRELTRLLLAIPYNPEYALRAQKTAAINAQMARNGVLIDLEAAQARSDEQHDLAHETLMWLHKTYDFPIDGIEDGKQPWKSNLGKAAIDRMMEEGGARVNEWARTPKGARSYSGENLLAIAKDTPLESTVERLAIITGMRTLADQLLRDTHNDGRIHPDISALQRSGRLSVTKPGVTTFGTRGEGKYEKRLFLPDPGFVFFEFDLSNADQRAVAFMSKDKEYAKRFVPGADGHEISGRLMFGDAEYEAQMLPGWETDDHIRKGNPLRHIAKALSHAYAYGAGAKKLAATSGQPLHLAQKFVRAMERAYPTMIAWQNRVRARGESGWVTNHWGRKMPVDPDRSYTQAPALMGQSSTTEMLNDMMLRLYEVAPEVLKWIKYPIHDAILVQLPEDDWRHYAEIILDCTKQTINGIDIFAEHGDPGDTWLAAMH